MVLDIFKNKRPSILDIPILGGGSGGIDTSARPKILSVNTLGKTPTFGKTRGVKQPIGKSFDLGITPSLTNTKTSTDAILKQPGPTEIGFVGPLGLLEDVGQDIARSFLSVGVFLAGRVPGEKKGTPSLKATYTPTGSIEKKIFGTDQPVNFETRGKEVLAIGGEDFQNKWGKTAVPIGLIMAGLDITPVGFGKKQILEQAAKTISKTDDVIKIAKALKPIVKGSDEEIKVLAKSLKLVSKEDDVLKVIRGVGEAKAVAKATPEAQKGVSGAIKAEKGIIPKELEPLAQEARKYKSVEEFLDKSNMVSFHGTNAPLKSATELSPQKISGDRFGFGFSFADNKRAAGAFGKNKLPAILKMNNPLNVDTMVPSDAINKIKAITGRDFRGFDGKIMLDRLQNELGSKKATEILKQVGFDGVVGREGQTIIRVVFDKNQIIDPTDIWNRATRGVKATPEAQKAPSKAIVAEKGIIPKETKILEWARGTRAAGIQNTGLKNYNEATRVLEKAGEIPTEIKTKNVTKDFIQNYYETKKSPVVGDVFINAKGERIEIIKIKDNAVDYFLKGKKKGIQGTVYTDKGFIEKIERITPKAIPKELEPLAAEARKYKSAEEFIKSPKYEYHLSNSADLVEGKTFSEQIGKVPTARRGIVGGADDAVFTTNNPQFWDSQLSKELGKDAPSNIYLVEVKNPSPRGMLESGFDAQASNLSKDVRIIKNLGKTGEGILDIGNIEFKKNQILTDIYTQATKGVARGGGEITPLQKVQSRFETILSNQKEKFNIKPASIESLSKKYKSVIPDAELVKYEQGYAEKRASTFRGEIDNLIKNLRESGVRDDVIKNTKIEGVPLDEIVRVKREINGSVSAIITKSDLDDIRLTFNGEIPTDKWVKRISVSEAKRGAGRLARLYEIPRLTFERWGLGDAVYQPIRQAERQANNMYVGFLKRFEDAGLFKRGGWVTADRFTISKPEAENIGKYYLTRQNKGYKVSFSDLSVKEKKFVEIFDGIIKETEDEFYRIAKLNGKDPGVIKNYAPLMTSGDIKIIDQVGDFDFIFRKHPAFFSLKERAKDVPVGLYELDYREIASRWLDGISKFNSLGEITPKIKYLTQSEEFKGIVGSEIANATTYWLKQTLNPSITKEVYQSVNYLARFLRKASATASLGLNYASVVKQTLTQIPLTIIEKAPPKLKSKFAKDFGINVADLASLRERKGTVAIADMQGKIGRIFTGSLTEFDRLNAQTSLNALLDKNYAKVLKGGEEITQDTVNYILQVSQDTLDMWYGGMTKSQLPTAFRSEVGKMINMFLLPLTSQLNGFFSRVLLAKGLGGKTKATAEVLSAAVVIAYLEQVISNLSPNWGDEKAMTKDVLVSLAGNIPIASQIAWSISTQDDIQITAGVSGISALAKELGKDDKEILTVALKASEALGLPKMVRRLIEGGEIISEGGVYDKNGKLLFEVEEMPEQIRTILRGKYGSLAGQEYIEGIGKKNEVIPTGTKNNIKMKGMNNIKMPGMRVPQMPNINKIMPKI